MALHVWQRREMRQNGRLPCPSGEMYEVDPSRTADIHQNTFPRFSIVSLSGAWTLFAELTMDRGWGKAAPDLRRKDVGLREAWLSYS